MVNPDMVCFCDIPFADLEIHSRKYSRFGLAFFKEFLTQRGARPVWYVPKNAPRYAPSVLPSEVTETAARIAGSSVVEEKIGEFFDRMLPISHDLMVKALIGESGARFDPRANDLYYFWFHSVFSFIKCFDHTLADEDPDNFYMEREWRVVGNVIFELGDVQAVFLPRDFAARFRVDLPSYSGQLHFIEESKSAHKKRGICQTARRIVDGRWIRSGFKPS